MAHLGRTSIALLWIKAVALLCFICLPLRGIDLSARVTEILGNHHGMIGVGVFVSLWVLVLASLIATAALPHWSARILLSVLIIPSTLASTIYYDVAGQQVLFGTVEGWWFERSLFKDALVAYKQFLPYAGVILGLGLLALWLPPQAEYLAERFRRLRVLSSRRFVVSSYVAATSIVFLLGSVVYVQAGEGLSGVPPHYKGTALMSVMWINQHLFEKSRSVMKVSIPRAQGLKPRPNIVLVVNESVRGDYLDINHDQGVTPFLFSQRERVFNFGYASSIANCSVLTHAGLRVGVNMANVLDSQQNNPFIWQYARAAGYRTVLIDGQVGQKKANNLMSKFERSLIDESIFLEHPDDDPEVWNRDRRLQVVLNRLLDGGESSSPYFIYFMQYGIHSPYEDKSPPSAIRFPLSGPDGAALQPKEKLINTYKNCVEWSVDTFFKDMLAEGRRFPNTVVIYTSDHGQNLLDNGKAVSHCTLKNPPVFEGLVPLLAITDHPDYAPRFALAARRNKDKATHFNIIPTILAIMGFDETGIRQHHGSLLFDDEIVESRRFLSDGIRLGVLGLSEKRKRISWNDLPIDLITDEGRAVVTGSPP
jgi:glucan phosphoethanolaminetransferase (alkaline phosphatase superfamily)